MNRFKVHTDFSFEDKYLESGIFYQHQMVEDSGKNWKPVHYDHGNGLALADVDGDGLVDLYFLTQMGANGLFRNLGKGRFEDATKGSGLAVADRVSVAGSFGDLDNDGDQDLVVTTVRMGNLLFENTGGGKFKDVSKTADFDYSGHSSGVVLFDFDNDGLLDIFVTNVGTYTHDEKGKGGFYLGMVDAFGGHLIPERAERSLLYKNLGGLRFREVSAELGLNDLSFAGDASFFDVNGDRFPELYVLNMQGDDHFYLNRGGRSFADQSRQFFPNTPWGSMGVKFFDFNNDGLFDLYLTDMHSDMSIEIEPRKEKRKADMQWSDDFLQGGDNNLFGNAFYVNRGKGSFLEQSDALGVENYWPWGLSVGDLNADGYQDIFVASSMNYHFRYGLNSVFLNNQGEAFLDAEFILGVEPRKTSVKPWFVLDCDGEDGEHRHCKGRSGRTLVWGTKGSRTSAVIDLDEDGDLDILTGEFNSEPQVLISNLTEKKSVKFLSLSLEGTASNRNGFGALVELKVGEQRYYRYHDGKSGYLSQSVLPLYFGLGNATQVDHIRVTWPSGKIQTLQGPIAINRHHRIVEPKP